METMAWNFHAVLTQQQQFSTLGIKSAGLESSSSLSFLYSMSYLLESFQEPQAVLVLTVSEEISHIHQTKKRPDWVSNIVT